MTLNELVLKLQEDKDKIGNREVVALEFNRPVDINIKLENHRIKVHRAELRKIDGIPYASGEFYCPELTFDGREIGVQIEDTRISPDEFAERMKKLSSINDLKTRHLLMDNLMLEVLKQFGYEKGSDIFEESDKYYY